MNIINYIEKIEQDSMISAERSNFRVNLFNELLQNHEESLRRVAEGVDYRTENLRQIPILFKMYISIYNYFSIYNYLE